MNGLHYAPDGRRLLAVGGYEVRSVDEARWMDVIDGTETMRVPLNASCYAVSKDLTRMAVGNSHSTSKQLTLPQLVTFDPIDSTWVEHSSRWRGAELVESSWPDSEKGVPSWRDLGYSEPVSVQGLAYHPDGEQVIASYDVDVVGTTCYFTALFDRNLNLARVCHDGTEGETYPALAFHPKGHLLAAGGKTNHFPTALICTDTMKHLHTRPHPDWDARGVVFSTDGDTLAVANAKSALLIPPELSAVRLTLAHPKQVNAVAFTPDGRRVLTTSTDKLVRVWDTTTGQLVVSYDWNVGVTNAIAVAPDGLTAAVSGQSGKVVLFDLEG